MTSTSCPGNASVNPVPGQYLRDDVDLVLGQCRRQLRAQQKGGAGVAAGRGRAVGRCEVALTGAGVAVEGHRRRGGGRRAPAPGWRSKGTGVALAVEGHRRGAGGRRAPAWRWRPKGTGAGVAVEGHRRVGGVVSG